jgi:hypothetical protein
MNCEARKGFLTLSSCDNPAATTCANCGRSLCPAHLAPPHFTTCLDCAATQGQNDPNAPQGEGEYDDVWAHGYRSRYYSSTGYTPGISSRDSYYDSQDTRSFDEQQSDDLADDTERGGFGES